MVYDAVVRNLQTMAESTQRLSEELKSKYPLIPWKNISGFRNILVHDYLNGIDEQMVWYIIRQDLPDLKKLWKKFIKLLADPKRIIAEDGLRIDKIKLEYLVLVIGEKVGGFMSKKTKYTKGEIGEIKIIEDFLPPPQDLVFKEDTTKITLSLSTRSIDFFKKEAQKSQIPYQRMIRSLLDNYTDHYA